jgi:hypothetical protein
MVGYFWVFAGGPRALWLLQLCCGSANVAERPRDSHRRIKTRISCAHVDGWGGDGWLEAVEGGGEMVLPCASAWEGFGWMVLEVGIGVGRWLVFAVLVLNKREEQSGFGFFVVSEEEEEGGRRRKEEEEGGGGGGGIKKLQKQVLIQ